MGVFYNLLDSSDKCSESSAPLPDAGAPMAEQLAALQQALAATQDELRRAKQRLAEQQEYYTTVLNHLQVEVVVFDTEHRYQFVNSQCFADDALRAWIIGKDDFDYCTQRERPVALAESRRRVFEEVVASRAEVVWEETLPSANGPQLMRRYMTPVLATDGSLRMVVGTGGNVTQRRQAELKLAAQRAFYECALSHIPCDIGVFDPQGRDGH
jgi:PAS domain-containing protein